MEAFIIMDLMTVKFQVDVFHCQHIGLLTKILTFCSLFTLFTVFSQPNTNFSFQKIFKILYIIILVH